MHRADVRIVRSRTALAGALLALASLTACAPAATLAGSAQSCLVPQASMRHELYFGLSRPDGSPISNTEFDQFISQVVTPLFGAGLTILDGSGQYRTATGTVLREPSKVVVLLYPDSQDVRDRVDRVISQYRTRFQQESVGWIRSAVTACF